MSSLSLFSFLVNISCVIFKKSFSTPRQVVSPGLSLKALLFFYLFHLDLQSTWTAFFIPCEVRVKFCFFPYGHQVVRVSYWKNKPSPLFCEATFVINQVSVYARVCFWMLELPSRFHVPIFILLSNSYIPLNVQGTHLNYIYSFLITMLCNRYSCSPPLYR